MDGEAGMTSEGAQTFLRHHGIKYVQRAPDQQVGHVDRRGALLRDTIHRVVDQCRHEDLNLSFDQIVSECVFCGNALLSINGTTPYNAVYGRVPAILPEMNVPLDEDPHTMRAVHRLREISVHQMVEGTARARIARAMDTRTLPAGQGRDFKIGDEVDFHRGQGSKDTSGWKGPARVIDNTNLSRGTVTVRFQRDLPH